MGTVDGRLDLWDTDRVNDYMAVAAVLVVVLLVMLRGLATQGLEELAGITWAMAVPAYLVSGGRRDWPLFVGALSILVATAVSWGAALLVGEPWTLGTLDLVRLVVVWAPWPLINNRRALLVFWALAWAPLVMLLVGPPLGAVGWVSDLITGERLEGLTGWNEVGIPAGIAVLSALALRLDRDTWVRYGLLCVGLVLLGGAGTRSMIPGVAVAAVLWFRYRRTVAPWRGVVIESVPCALFLATAARPAFLRTVEAVGAGVDGATNNRGSILSQYWGHAVEALWSGHGHGTTRMLLESHQVDVEYLPHNGLVTLIIDVGIPAALIVVLGFAILILHRSSQIRGPARWLLRVPLLLFLPVLFLVDHGLWKPFLTVPILLFASAAPGVQRAIEAPHRWRT